MIEKELENLIKESISKKELPSRESLVFLLSKIEPVTNNEVVRYSTKTETSNIINKLVTNIDIMWKRKFVLVPSLIAIVIVGAFSLSPKVSVYTHNRSIQKLAEQDAIIESIQGEEEELSSLTNFEEPDIIDIGDISNEL